MRMCTDHVAHCPPLPPPQPQTHAGKREADERNKFTLPEGLRLKNLERITRGAASTADEPADGSKARVQAPPHWAAGTSR